MECFRREGGNMEACQRIVSIGPGETFEDGDMTITHDPNGHLIVKYPGGWDGGPHTQRYSPAEITRNGEPTTKPACFSVGGRNPHEGTIYQAGAQEGIVIR